MSEELNTNEWTWNGWTNVSLDNTEYIINLVTISNKSLILVFVPIAFTNDNNQDDAIFVAKLDDDYFIRQCSDQGFQRDSINQLKAHLSNSIYNGGTIQSLSKVSLNIQIILQINCSMSINIFLPIIKISNEVLTHIYNTSMQYLIRNICMQNIESNILKQTIQTKYRAIQYISEQICTTMDDKEIIKKWVPPGSIHSRSLKPLSETWLDNTVVNSYHQAYDSKPIAENNHISKIFKRFQMWTTKYLTYKKKNSDNFSDNNNKSIDVGTSSFDENFDSLINIDDDEHSLEGSLNNSGNSIRQSSDTDVSETYFNNVNGNAFESNSYHFEVTPELQQNSTFGETQEENSDINTDEHETIYHSPKKRRVFGKVKSQK
ncbi:hypothetical protein TPHA_0F02530 [Tetrapisispora phaffii CBS 4417]|uniref:Uncharacterized protein n=1 Tax=Tetrapisispora phaffii (strain ATCC 24235 / CBS 4417 / NBRC 1672 / NRRL Y-8282 / UCD 70-5) TaxID=1071381 RepID=G8BUE8_TETPH|nr:hypothetical protein TPHA_0F02530 [Tetrapisispora phaffii CBS 4417]CCE63734.1 hypothetical protein TPHA_0F02530 [Tetrapisispora phaffii CBS 4417]